MDRRHPSSFTTGGYSSIRRRSGGVDKVFRPSSNPSNESPSCLTTARNPQNQPTHPVSSPKTLTIQVEDMDLIDSNPVTILVQSASSTSPARLDLRRLYDKSNPHFRNLPLPPQEGLRPESNNIAFIDVPLTPRPARYTANDTQDSSVAHAPNSNVSKRNSSFSLARLMSMNDRPRAPSLISTSQEPFLSPEPDRAAKNSTTLHIAPPFFSSSTGKYTQKWPKPRINPRAIGGLVAALEDGEGIGMDSVDRWPVHKWVLLISAIAVFIYSFAGLVCAILTWFRGWEHADVMYVADGDILALVTVAASILMFTSLVGIGGTLLNSRPLLAIYCLLLWTAFISLAAIGYTSYRRSTFSLDRKLNLAWSQWYNPTGRLTIQNSLQCCGYYDALHEATSSKRCFPRTTLPGCKSKLYQFERGNLNMIWSTVFALVPIHIIVIIVSLLCSNHVNKTFGKGIMPRSYRLGAEDVQLDTEHLLSQFKNVGVISRPILSRPSSSMTFREDRVETRHLVSAEKGQQGRWI